MVELFRITEFDHAPNKPGWIKIVTAEGEPCKPIIRCNCGLFVGLGLHHVHADGTVTNSFYHKKGSNYSIGEHEDGCEWHVWLKLLDYDDGEFLPNQKTRPKADQSHLLRLRSLEQNLDKTAR